MLFSEWNYGGLYHSSKATFTYRIQGRQTIGWMKKGGIETMQIVCSIHRIMGEEGQMLPLKKQPTIRVKWLELNTLNNTLVVAEMRR